VLPLIGVPLLLLLLQLLLLVLLVLSDQHRLLRLRRQLTRAKQMLGQVLLLLL
jgi:hypothetical protein